MHLRDIESIIPVIEKEFNICLEVIGGIKKRGYSEHDIDLLICSELDIPLIHVSEEDWYFESMIYYWVLELDEPIKYLESIAKRVRQLLNLPEGYRIDFFLRVPDKARKVSEETGEPVYLIIWGPKEDWILYEEYINVADVKYIIISFYDNEIFIGYLKEIK